MDELNNLINETTEEIKNVGDNYSQGEQGKQSDQGNQTEVKRKELILLSSNGEHPKSVSFLEKASAKVIEKLYSEYETKTQEKDVTFLCDLTISNFATLLESFDVIEKPSNLEKKLKANPLLQKDLKTVMTYITPLIPFLGILSAGVIVGRHMWNKSKQGEQSNQSEHSEQGEHSEHSEHSKK